jgi:hypothetical protein
MKQRTLPFLFFLSFILGSFNVAAQAVNTQDSLALVDLYNNTNGAGWTNNRNWLTTAPIAGWYGVTVVNGRVGAIILTNNQLKGVLPASIGNLSELGVLRLDINQLSGPIPVSITSLTLASLELGFNQLSGTIPTALGSMISLSVLQLNNNQLTGSIPASLGSDVVLDILDLSANELTGTIPAFVGLPVVATINLSNNQLSGSMPVLSNLPGLYLINVENNRLTGGLPVSYADLPKLEVIWADHNQLTGGIPDGYAAHTAFVSLFFGFNQLSGKLPDGIGNLTKLISLTLNNNQFSGPIPASISRLSAVPVTLDNNAFTFAGIANLKPITSCTYAPQASIPLVRSSDTLYVAAGGVAANETFSLYRNGALVATQTGDSLFAITSTGKYNIVSTNTDAPLLTLYSDTVAVPLVLPVHTCSANVNIAGVPVDVNSGIFNMLTLTPGTGGNGLSGAVACLETIDPAVSTFDGTPYVQRHYDVTPAINASNAQATVTLYFSQSDFDAFNNYVTANQLSVPLMPSAGVDNGSIRVNQFHGSYTGTSTPANYTGSTVLIAPVVAWDATNSWWTVTFPVSGFSGFFLSTKIVPLPLTLLQFTGVVEGKTVGLSWKTTNELNTSQFVVERSGNGSSFNAIGTVAATNLAGENDYQFTDAAPLAGDNSYRLKIVDVNGKSTYSTIVLISAGGQSGAYLVYPNPVHGLASVVFNTSSPGKYCMQVIDPLGRPLQVLNGVSVAGANKVDIEMGGYSAGVYTIVISDPVMGRRSLRFTKE